MVCSLGTEYTPALVSLPPPEDAVEGFDVENYHPFPAPSTLAGPEVAANLRKLGFGYRADFIQKTAKMLVDGHGGPKNTGQRPEPAEEWLHTLRQMSTEDARAELLKLMGVGRKVADCVLLMSLDKVSAQCRVHRPSADYSSKREVVPVDTHVHDIAKKHYGLSGSKAKANMTPQLYDTVNAKLAGVWGEYAGWAHSVSRPPRPTGIVTILTHSPGAFHLGPESLRVVRPSVSRSLRDPHCRGDASPQSE